MSRQIPLDQPLTDEDRRYLQDRGRTDLINFLDNEFPTEPTSDSFLGTQHPEALSVHLEGSGVTAAMPTLTPQTGMSAPSPEPVVVEPVAPSVAPAATDSSDEDEGDNYDDAEAWTYQELQEEVKIRKRNGAPNLPALNSSRDVLIAFLREDDKRG